MPEDAAEVDAARLDLLDQQRRTTATCHPARLASDLQG